MSTKTKRFEELKPCRTNRSLDGFPDEILLYICSFLSLKEAVGTSILSRRWRYLWTSLPRLNFPVGNQGRDFVSRGMINIEDEKRYKRMVNQVLRLYMAQNLHEFSIRFPFRRNSSGHIDRWVAFAIAKGVSRLELDFYFYGSTFMNNYSIPHDLFDDTKGIEPYLKLQSDGIFSVTTSFLIAHNGLKSLTQLFLRYVDLTDELFGIILSNCSSLECLLLHSNHKLLSAKYTGHDRLKLKCLEIYCCSYLEDIQVYAPNLVEFKYEGRKVNICIKDAQQLVNLSIIYHYNGYRGPSRGKFFVLGQFSAYLSQLEYLIVDVYSYMGTIASHKFPIFRNLKQLSLYDVHYSPTWRWNRATIPLINASPFLHRLELHLSFCYFRGPRAQKKEEEERKNTIIMSPHRNLKEVLVSGFVDEFHMEFITSIVDKAVALEKIEMTRSSKMIEGDLEFLRRPDNTADADYIKCPSQLLSPKLPPNVQFIMF